MTRLAEKTLGFIGGGQMAEAVLGGILHAKAIPVHRICAADVDANRLSYLSEAYGINIFLNDAAGTGARSLINACDVVVLSIKPQYLRPLLEAAGSSFDPAKHIVISIVGGAPLKLLESFIKAPIVRVMPNTPMLVREGAAGLSKGNLCSDADLALAKEIFDLVGESYILPESLIDPLTSISGCGPAYAYMFIEALADGGVEMGLSRETATRLAAKTLLGSAKMVLEGGHPARLKDNVCSPGGSTIAGVHALEHGKFRGTLMDAVQAGRNRMAEIGKNI